MRTFGNTVILAEKPSVARDLARAVGAFKQGDGVLHGNGYTVTWAIGHLVTLPEPHQIQSGWKTWSFAQLPMLPREWPLVVVERTKAQFEIVRKALRQCDEVICATDAGREGELIFRYIYEMSNCKKPIKRLWISSLTPDAIQTGLRTLRAGSDYEPLADAARARSRADWLMGMNLSRAYALMSNEQLFVGRVQTPTLAMVVERDLKIQNFVPEDYFVIEGHFKVSGGEYRGIYLGEKAVITNPIAAKEKRLPLKEKDSLEKILPRLREGGARKEASLLALDGKSVRQPAPLLYDLTELQRHCNRVFGFSATKTLGLAQGLYEHHKLISYPRSDSRHLSQSVAATLPAVVAAIRAPYEGLLDPSVGGPLSSRFVDDSKVSDHHAIIPTSAPANLTQLASDERKVFDLICRRLLMAWSSNYVTQITTVITDVGGVDLFKTQGTAVVALGWKALDLKTKTKTPEPDLPSGLKAGVPVALLKVEAQQKRTEPPPHLTEATLLTGMESAGRNLEERELAEIMRGHGLGTPATRASIIETLLLRNYIVRKEKSLIATPLGIRLIETVHSSVKSPELTARWEIKLAEIQERKYTLKKFMHDLEHEVAERVAEIAKSKKTGFPSPLTPQLTPQSLNRVPTTTPPDQLPVLLKKTFGFASFRDGQESVCRAVTEGQDVLLVMPTGAGKSICYQIPGLARGGTCLVVSPLVALIEDQVSKLQAVGIAAERIHSGRSREDSRLVCQKYLAGQLNFLFIAPERLALPGFAEFLRRAPPRLIAIDEAHCISQWGHDFRPDYRILGERLNELRPAPVIALTATATPAVQEDICRQLGLRREQRIIQGFRRTNIAIEVAELSPGDRPAAIQAILKKAGRLPAIVYAPTRKKADELTQLLARSLRAGSYHAGMAAAAREKTQAQFLNHELDVIVATVAFGMGIDKANIRSVIHAALPGSIEGYYQEIGRAGRDGLPSQAYLLHSFVDQKTHEFFFELNYPDPDQLKSIYNELKPKKIAKDLIQAKLKRLDEETFARALEQLWVHRGVVLDPEENVSRGHSGWENSYNLQRDLKRKQLKQMSAFTGSGKCRMVHLVLHFGDQNDDGKRCGICDICNPPSSDQALNRKRRLTLSEQKVVHLMLAALERERTLAAGRLFQIIESEASIARREFEVLRTVLERSGWIDSHDASFEKDGKTISYRRLSLARGTRNPAAAALETLEIRETREIKSKFRSRRSSAKTKSKSSPRRKRARATASPGGYAKRERLNFQFRLSQKHKTQSES